jgi:hypothetical protein
MHTTLDRFFPRLDRFFPRHPSAVWQAPMWCITPQIDRCIHRFHDSSPISPSGRFVALTRLPYDDKVPVPGDRAEIVLVDVLEGTTRIIAETRGWDTQLGAQVQWGSDDHALFFNDVDILTWRPFGVRLDPSTEERQSLDGPVYAISPDGKLSASPCLLRTARTQRGYGVVVPESHVPKNPMAADDDGIYLTDTETGASRLLVSLAAILECARPALDPQDFRSGSLYGFHVKWNPQGDRLMFVMRWKPDQGRRRPTLITMKPDGSDITVALHWQIWQRGGHHPNWCPDGKKILMNLIADDGALRFVTFDYDGSNLEVAVETCVGSGHPTLHPNGRNILTDALVGESTATQHGKVPLRWIDIHSKTEAELAWIDARPTNGRRALRVNSRPAWDRECRRFVFNACPERIRRVYICDVTNLL